MGKIRFIFSSKELNHQRNIPNYKTAKTIKQRQLQDGTLHPAEKLFANHKIPSITLRLDFNLYLLC